MAFKMRYSNPDNTTVTGKVSNHAIAIDLMVFFCRFLIPLLATMEPAIPDDNTWVVLTGRLNEVAAWMVVAATNSALAPWAYERCCLPIFSPMVITILFQPTIVP